MKNKEIREAVKRKGVRMWQIAEEMHIQDSAFSRKLRHELPAEEKAEIMKIIDKLTKGAV